MTAQFRFEPPAELLNLNRRRHHQERARIAKEWRSAAAYYGRQKRAGKRSHLVPCVVTVHLPVKGNRRRDPHNFIDTVKPIIDGLVDAGFWPDDTPDYVTVAEPVLEVGETHVYVVLRPREEP